MPGQGRFAQGVSQSCSGPQEGIGRNAHALSDLVGGAEADSRQVDGQAVGIGANSFDGFFPVNFVDAHGPAGADALGVEEDHDLANDLLFGPGGLDLVAAGRSDALDFAQTDGTVLDDVEDLFAEFVDEFLGILGADALDEAAAEVFLNPLQRSRRGATDQVGLQLEPVFAVAHPMSFGHEPLARIDRRERTDHSGQSPRTLALDADDGEAGLLVVEGHSLDQPCHAFARRRGGIDGCAHGRGFTIEAAARINKNCGAGNGFAEETKWFAMMNV